MEYNSGLNKKEIVQYLSTWMNLEDVDVNEINQSQKDKYCIIPLI